VGSLAAASPPQARSGTTAIPNNAANNLMGVFFCGIASTTAIQAREVVAVSLINPQLPFKTIQEFANACLVLVSLWTVEIFGGLWEPS
jgi:hypothetical protein